MYDTHENLYNFIGAVRWLRRFCAIKFIFLYKMRGILYTGKEQIGYNILVSIFLIGDRYVKDIS